VTGTQDTQDQLLKLPGEIGALRSPKTWVAAYDVADNGWAGEFLAIRDKDLEFQN